MRSIWKKLPHSIPAPDGAVVPMASSLIDNERGQQLLVVWPAKTSVGNQRLLFEQGSLIYQQAQEEMTRRGEPPLDPARLLYFERLDHDNFRQRDPQSFAPGFRTEFGEERVDGKLTSRENINQILSSWILPRDPSPGPGPAQPEDSPPGKSQQGKEENVGPDPMEEFPGTSDPSPDPSPQPTTKTWELVQFPDPYGPPVRLWAELTTQPDGTEIFLFAQRGDNQSPRWHSVPMRLRQELVNAITNNGKDMSPHQFRFIEYRPGTTQPFEEYLFEMGPKKKLCQNQIPIRHSVKQMQRIIPGFRSQRLPEPPRQPPVYPDNVGKELAERELPQGHRDPDSPPKPDSGWEPSL